MGQDVLALLPQVCLLAGAVAVLLTGSFLPPHRLWVTRVVTLATLLATAVAAGVGLARPARTVMDGTFAVDGAYGAAVLVVAAGTFLVVVLGVGDLGASPREGEAYALLLLAALGALVLAGASDLLVLATGYLLASIPLYALVGLDRSPPAAEAALKTYLLGALLGITLLLGVTVLYGIGGSTAYASLARDLDGAPTGALALGAVAVLGGLMFKAGGVPGHFWVPDAAQGAGTAVAAFVTTVPKVGALVGAYRLVDTLPATVDVRLLVALLAAASMTLGNLAAFAQTDPRRLLGWSTVSQVGYLLLPVAVAGRSELALPSLLVYLAGYAVSNVGAFAVVAALPGLRDLAAYRGLATSRPVLAWALLACLLSLVGTPPTVVFVGKLTTFTAAWDGGLAWLAVLAAANTVASLFYYLRWLAPAFRPAGPEAGAEPLRPPLRWAAAAAAAAGLAVLGLGLSAGLTWGLADAALAR